MAEVESTIYINIEHSRDSDLKTVTLFMTDYIKRASPNVQNRYMLGMCLLHENSFSFVSAPKATLQHNAHILRTLRYICLNLILLIWL